MVTGAKFRESIILGTTYMSSTDITRTIDVLRSKYRGDTYNVVTK